MFQAIEFAFISTVILIHSISGRTQTRQTYFMQDGATPNDKNLNRQKVSMGKSSSGRSTSEKRSRRRHPIRPSVTGRR